MRAIMMLAVLLSLVLFSSCDKKDVEPKGELIEVSFNATPYGLDFETETKSIPGYPDIPHNTDLNLYNVQVAIQNTDDESSFELTTNIGEFDNAVMLLDKGNYIIEWGYAYDNQQYYTASSTRFYREVHSYDGASIYNNTSTPEHIIYEIDTEESQIDFEIVMGENCFVFSDPEGLIDEVTEEGESKGTGIPKAQMNTIDYNGETFYYCYYTVAYSDKNLWIYTTDGGRVNLNFGDYYASLSEEEQFIYAPIGGNVRTGQPFTVYTTVVKGTSSLSSTAFAVSKAYPAVEVEITTE